jgi:hypothetical protein
VVQEEEVAEVGAHEEEEEAADVKKLKSSYCLSRILLLNEQKILISKHFISTTLIIKKIFREIKKINFENDARCLCCYPPYILALLKS